MPIVCLEGPSAVGKTTLAAALAESVGAFLVPEVNLLFERPADEPTMWYLERQAERWAIAAKEAADGALVVLDGDVFQPLWYNWSYGFEGRQSLDALEAFYRPRLASGEIGFPALYAVLRASEETLRARKEADATRRRGGFETHLR
ncbi:MAG TPA: AAA family ATPase, partial [Longimicrobium sp.]|nr:AAA family ATPase [Longimicrobium sp.]